MTQTLAAMQSAYKVHQASSQVQSALGAGGAGGLTDSLQSIGGAPKKKKKEEEEPPGLLERLNPLQLCSNPEDNADAGDEDDDDRPVAPATELSKFLLRMCVYSGQDIVRVSSCPQVVINEGRDDEQIFEGELITASSTPVWEFDFETEVVLEGYAPDCEIRILGDRGLGKSRLGACAVALAAGTTDAPKSQLIKLSKVETLIPGLTERPPSKIRVVWELTNVDAPKYRMPDLVRVAEMSSLSTEKRDMRFQMTFGTMRFAKPITKPRAPRVIVKVELRGRKQSAKPNVYGVKKASLDSTEGIFDVPKATRRKEQQAPTVGEEVKLLEDEDEIEEEYAENFGKQKAQETADKRKDFLRAINRTLDPTESIKRVKLHVESVDLVQGTVQLVNDKKGQDKKKATFPIRCLQGYHNYGVQWNDCYFGPEATQDLEQKTWKPELWSVYTSEVNLLSNSILIRAFSIHGPEDTKLLFGTWEEDVGNLMSSIDYRNSRLEFDAEISNAGGDPMALIRMTLDIFWNAPHRSTTKRVGEVGEYIAKTAAEMRMMKGLPRVPLKRGIQKMIGGSEVAMREVTYACSCYLDGLPSHLTNLQPYVKIRMSHSAKAWGETPPAEENSYYSVEFSNQAKVVTQSSARKAEVQFWSKDPGMAGGHFFGHDTLLGEATIYDITPGKIAWCHCYGGAFGGQPSNDLAMTKGAISPASTYHGTVAIHFDLRSRPASGVATEREREKVSKRLVVRLHRALYLPKSYHNSLVSVIVEVAGCYLPVDGMEHDKRRKYNRSLLAFPGEVDGSGVLRFKMQEQQGLMSVMRAKFGSNYAWIQRSTPRDHVLRVPPGIEHAYLYIVRVGQEDEPPELFTRIRLKHVTNEFLQKEKEKQAATVDSSVKTGDSEAFLDTAKTASATSSALGAMDEKQQRQWIDKVNQELSNPVWKRIRKDQSVTPLDPKEKGDDDFAGFILGSAALIDREVLEAAPEESPEETAAPQTPLDGPLDLGDIQIEGAKLITPFKKLKGTPMKVPKMTYPMSMMCKPFVGDTYHRVGPPGEPSEIIGMELNESNTRTVYAHVDILAARDLEARDSEGLCTATYDIKVANMLEEPPKTYTLHNTNNPNFYCRHRIELQVCDDDITMNKAGTSLKEPPAEASDELYLPMPPIIVYMRDAALKQLWKDKTDKLLADPFSAAAQELDTNKGEAEAAGRIGTIAIKRPEIFTEEVDKPVDVNSKHRAVWHGVQVKAHSPWDPSQGGQVAAWKGRPRVLIACSYSMSKKLKMDDKIQRDALRLPEHLRPKSEPHAWRMIDIGDPEIFFEKFDITLDLLGLRGLHHSSQALIVKSLFHDKDCKISLDDNDRQNPNFIADRPQDDWPEIANAVKDMLRIRNEREQEDATFSGDPGTPTEETADDDVESVATSCDISDFLGCRMVNKDYQVPIIPYLQDRETRIKEETWPKMEYKDDWEQILRKEALKKYQLTTKSMLRRYVKVKDKHERVIRQFHDEFAEDVNENRFPLTIRTVTPDSLVLMPELVFKLHSWATNRNIGSMTLQIPRPPKALEDELVLQSWYTKATEERNAQPKSWKDAKLCTMKDLQLNEEAYDVFMDVFAAKKGYLMFENDLKLGRCIREQKLFTIQSKTADDKKDKKDAPKSKTEEEEYFFKQYFNPADWMLGDARFLDEPFDHRINPYLKCATWNIATKRWESAREKQTLPLSKRDLFQGFLSQRSSVQSDDYRKTMQTRPGQTEAKPRRQIVCNSEADLIDMRTKDLKMACAAREYRCVSHLHVPEDVTNMSVPQQTANPSSEQDLKKNLRCFMREVGHQIRLGDRDSKYLCKLRLCPPEDFLQPIEKGEDMKVEDYVKLYGGQELDAVEKCPNFLMIRFKLPGVVIWAPPTHVDTWRRPGKVLFVVRTNDGNMVPVVVPSFDLRFPHETAYYPNKTLNRRWRTLELLIANNQQLESQAQQLQKKKDKSKVRKVDKDKLKKAASQSEATEVEVKDEDDNKEAIDAGEDIEEEKIESDADEPDARFAPPDGFSKPLWVHENAFVVRLRKRPGGLCFDRVQTKNWYRVVLEQVCPEVRNLRAPDQGDTEHTKRMFFDRFMNIRKYLTDGGDGTEPAGLVKGHIRVSKAQVLSGEKAYDDQQKELMKERQEKNLGQKLVGGLDGLVKGASPLAVPLPLSDVFGGHLEQNPKDRVRPVEDFWVSYEVAANVYILTANDLKLPHLPLEKFTSNLNLTVTVEIVGGSKPLEKQIRGLKSEDLKATGKIDFYAHFPIGTSVPGPSTLRISIWAKPPLSLSPTAPRIDIPGFGSVDQVAHGTLLGSAEIDLEDRWFALQRRLHRSACNPEYVENHICPAKKEKKDAPCVPYSFKIEHKKPEDIEKEVEDEHKALRGYVGQALTAAPTTGLFGGGDEQDKVRRKFLLNPMPVQLMDSGAGVGGDPKKPGTKSGTMVLSQRRGEGEGFEIAPRVSSADPLPIEIVDLEREDEDTAVASKVGILRLWVDLSAETAEYLESKLSLKPAEFEVRVLIKGIYDISVFKDPGERNDAFVSGIFSFGDFGGKVQNKKFETAVHTWAQSEAHFNERFVFSVNAPATICSVKLCIEDRDLVTDNDPIYYAKDVSLDHLLMLAYRNNNECKAPLGNHSMVIKFDDWPSRGKRYHCCCCCKYRAKENKEGPCYLHMDVQILPKGEADLHPCLTGVVAPPAMRLGWMEAIQNPVRFAKIFLGPINYKIAKRSCIGILVVLILLLLLAAMFFFAQGILVPFEKGWEKR